MSKRVWYAAFGSNLSYERFLVYLDGGQAKDSIGSTPGARDATRPLRSVTTFTTHALSFGGSSARWSGGGVAFLHTEPGESHTFLRLYDITAEQFEDVFQQENGLPDPLPIDLGRVMADGWSDETTRWYGRVLFLGVREDQPIFTITSPNPPKLNRPHVSYLRTIVDGMRSLWPEQPEQIRAQLMHANGLDELIERDWIEALAP